MTRLWEFRIVRNQRDSHLCGHFPLCCWARPIISGGRLRAEMMSEFWTRWACGVCEDAILAFEYSVLKFRRVMWAGDSVLEESTCTS